LLPRTVANMSDRERTKTTMVRSTCRQQPSRARGDHSESPDGHRRSGGKPCAIGTDKLATVEEGLTGRQANEIVGGLITLGEIEIVRKGTSNKKGRKRRANTYRYLEADAPRAGRSVGTTYTPEDDDDIPF
jgi:hypothetical protein